MLFANLLQIAQGLERSRSLTGDIQAEIILVLRTLGSFLDFPGFHDLPSRPLDRRFLPGVLVRPRLWRRDARSASDVDFCSSLSPIVEANSFSRAFFSA